MITHTDGIWISDKKERETVKQLTDYISACGYTPVAPNNNNFGYPTQFSKGKTTLASRLVDLVEDADIVITDNHPLVPYKGRLHSVLPEFWHQWRFDPVYIERPSSIGYNCFMARERGDRDRVFNILKQRNIIDKGLVSYLAQGYDKVNSHGTLEQCIIDTNVSLILETYIRDDVIVFSEKIFRALQMPRPWLLYCSPHSIELLRTHGFDVLEDIVDNEYDTVSNHWNRLDKIIDQLETFVTRQYTRRDYERFQQAATTNKQLLDKFAREWPLVLDELMLDIKHPELDWTVT
ncbi:hypothetical protein OAP74_00785 [bacterium]|nr:hypothetical protein [bacterium]